PRRTEKEIDGLSGTARSLRCRRTPVLLGCRYLSAESEPVIVHFSRHFDGMQPSPPETAVGVAAAGPQRLLCLLEQQLGLPTPTVRPGEALLAYQSCLEDLDSPARFYHASLEVDGLGVARALLGWRAAWSEAGWRGRFSGTVSRRLADLAEVEALARERVPPCDGQRLARFADALDSGLVTQIERI